MKTLFFLLAFATTLVLCGTSFFVPQTQGLDTVAGMVVLSDADMAAQNGGYGQWRSEQTRAPSGSFANCSQRPCPTWTHRRTFGHYRCAPCEGTESTYTRVYTTKVEISWCASFSQPDKCEYRHHSDDYHWSCVAYTGSCGDHTW